MNTLKLISAFSAIVFVSTGSALAVEVPDCDETVTIETTNAKPYIYFDGGGLRSKKTTISIFDEQGNPAGSVSIQLETVQGKNMPGCYYTPGNNSQSYCRDEDTNPSPVDATLNDDFENNLVCY